MKQITKYRWKFRGQLIGGIFLFTSGIFELAIFLNFLSLELIILDDAWSMNLIGMVGMTFAGIFILYSAIDNRVRDYKKGVFYAGFILGQELH